MILVCQQSVDLEEEVFHLRYEELKKSEKMNRMSLYNLLLLLFFAYCTWQSSFSKNILANKFKGINKFCDDVGITTRVSIIPIEKLEQFVRLDLGMKYNNIIIII
jgi:hypothetical protein